jgi:hypothetical protein
MLPHRVALLAPALRPALLAAHKALQPGAANAALTSLEVLSLLPALRHADDATADALHTLEHVVDNQAATDSEVFAIGAAITRQIEELIVACNACQSLDISKEPLGRHLAEAARDVLVTYTHYLADLIFATADPAALIREGEAVHVEGTRFDINLACKTNLPDSLDTLSVWVPGRFSYDDARARRVLKVSENPLVYRPSLVELPPEPPPPEVKPMSFWSILCWAGLLSLIFGHDCGDCGD